MPTHQQSYLSAMLDQVAECFTPDVARRVLAIQLDVQTHARVEELAEKANEGLLSEQERSEYLAYIEASDLVAILQAKARRLLAHEGA